MFNWFKKYLLIITFLGLVPSIYAMETGYKNSWFRTITGYLYKLLPSIPSKIGGYNIRKHNKQDSSINNNNDISIDLKPETKLQTQAIDSLDTNNKPQNMVQDKIQNSIPNEITAAVFLYILKIRANKELLDKLDIAKNNNFNREEDLGKIKKCINQGASEAHLKNLFKNLAYKKKYEQYLLNTKLIETITNNDITESWNIIQEVLEKGADPNYKNLFNTCPEYYRCYLKYIDLNTEFENTLSNARNTINDSFQKVKQYIKDKKISPNYCVGGKTPLIIYAIKYCPKDFVYFLLESGANPNVEFTEDNNKITPLFLEISKYYPELDIIKRLIKFGANINKSCLSEGKYTSILEKFLNMHKGNNTKDIDNILNILFKSGISLSNKDFSVFHYIAGYYNCKFVPQVTNEQLERNIIIAVLTSAQDAHKRQDHRSMKNFNIILKQKTLPKKLLHSILSMLPENHFTGIDAETGGKTISLLASKDQNSIHLLYHVMTHIVRIEKLLQYKNKDNKTPFQFLIHDYMKAVKSFENNPDSELEKYLKKIIQEESIGEISKMLSEISNMYHYLKNKECHLEETGHSCSHQEILLLFKTKIILDLNEDRPRNDFIAFINAFPLIENVPKDNWAGITYRYLLENNKSKNNK